MIFIPIFSCFHFYGNTTTASDVFCFFAVHRARDLSAPNVFGLQLFVNTACLFHVYQSDVYYRYTTNEPQFGLTRGAVFGQQMGQWAKSRMRGVHAMTHFHLVLIQSLCSLPPRYSMLQSARIPNECCRWASCRDMLQPRIACLMWRLCRPENIDSTFSFCLHRNIARCGSPVLATSWTHGVALVDQILVSATSAIGGHTRSDRLVNVHHLGLLCEMIIAASWSDVMTSDLVRFAMSPKRVWRDFCVQIELGVEIANLGGE